MTHDEKLGLNHWNWSRCANEHMGTLGASGCICSESSGRHGRNKEDTNQTSTHEHWSVWDDVYWDVNGRLDTQKNMQKKRSVNSER